MGTLPRHRTRNRPGIRKGNRLREAYKRTLVRASHVLISDSIRTSPPAKKEAAVADVGADLLTEVIAGKPEGLVKLEIDRKSNRF